MAVAALERTRRHDVGSFPEVAAARGIVEFGRAGGTILEDFDNDGHLDLMLSHMQPTDERTNRYALRKAPVGWRADHLGDLRGFETGWNYMEALGAIAYKACARTPRRSVMPNWT